MLAKQMDQNKSFEDLPIELWSKIIEHYIEQNTCNHLYIIKRHVFNKNFI